MTASEPQAIPPRLGPRASLALFALLAATVYIADFTLLRGPHFSQHATLLGVGVLVDVLLVVPALYFFLLVWRFDYPRAGIAVALYAGAAFGYLLLPAEANWVQQALPYWRMAMLLAAAVMLALVAVRVGRALRASQAAQLRGEARVNALAEAASLGQPRVAGALRSEWLVLYYALVGWRREPVLPVDAQAFTYYQKTGARGLLIGFSVMQLPEVPLLHWLLSQWSLLAAWIVTTISIYGLTFAPALAVALRHRPILLHDGRLLLRLSLAYEAELPLAAISACRGLHWRDELPKGGKPLKLHLMSAPNVLIELTQPQQALRMFGLRQRYDRVHLYVDEPARFIAAVNAVMNR